MGTRLPVGPILCDSFLGGSAPRLRIFELTGILFPGLPELLLSATHLVELFLFELPLSGYISPETLVIALSTSTNFVLLSLRFDLALAEHADGSPPQTRSVLPALTARGSTGSVNTWRTSWPASILSLLNSLHATAFNINPYLTQHSSTDSL